MSFLDLKYPLVVAPMAGGPSSPELVIASSEAGALGSVGAAYSKPQDIEEFANSVRAKTKKPFAINLFIPTPHIEVTKEALARAIKGTEKFRQKYNLPAPKLELPYDEDFDLQFETVLKVKPKVFSFVFGLLKPEYVRAAKKEDIYLIGTATTVDEALALEESGVDAITLQGVEAGGHRGIFDASVEDPQVKAMDLLKACKAKIKTPLIAAGGLMNAQDIQQMLKAGAAAVQMGTAFLAVKEGGTSKPYREKLLESAERKTKLTRAFSGRIARGLENRFMTEIDANPESILPFPAQNKFTRDIRKASAVNSSAEALSLWSGTGNGELWTGTTKELIEQLFKN